MSSKLRKKKSFPFLFFFFNFQISKMAPTSAFVQKQFSANLKAVPKYKAGAVLLSWIYINYLSS